MNSIIYYNNKYPQDYGILYMDTPESDLLSIDKLTDYKKGIRMYGLISCIGVFILPNPNTLIGGHFVDERDIDFLTKMDNIIMNDCSAASAKSGASRGSAVGDLDLGEAGRRAVEEAASAGGDCVLRTEGGSPPQGLLYLFYRNTNVSGQLNNINTNKNFLKNRYEKFFNKIIEIGIDRSYVNVTFMEFIDDIMWDSFAVEEGDHEAASAKSGD